MATNFPDTSILNPNTGFAWAEGDTFDDTANSGYIYYWYDPVWKTALSQSDSDDRYVNIGGDTMSGSLALTDKITLNADTGSVDFADEVSAGTNSNECFLAPGGRGGEIFTERSALECTASINSNDVDGNYTWRSGSIVGGTRTYTSLY